MSTRLNLRIHEVKCVDETGSKVSEIFSKDQIYIGGFRVDSGNKTHPIATFLVGNEFEDAEIKKYIPPKIITFFSLGAAFADTRKYAAGILLFKKNKAQIPELNIAVFNELKRLVSEHAAIQNSIAWPEIKPKIDSFIKNAEKGKGISDSMFPLQDAIISIQGSNHTWDGKSHSPAKTLKYNALDGIYHVTYSWQLE